MAKDPVLYVIACGGRPAADLPPFVDRLRSDGWAVCVVSTPSGMKFLDADRLAGLTGFGLMSAFAELTLGAVASRQGTVAQEATRRAETANAVLIERSHLACEIHLHVQGVRMHGVRVRAMRRFGRATQGCCELDHKSKIVFASFS